MVPNHTLDQEPNARLIAAAPDLLEACEQAVQHLEATPDAGRDGLGTVTKLKEAIKKAKCTESNSQESRGDTGLVERRKRKRFEVKKPLFAVSSEPFPRLGEITDICEGGLAFTYSMDKSASNGFSKLDIFMVQRESGTTAIKSLPVDPKWEAKMYGKTRKQGVQFRRLTRRQRSQLISVIEECSVKEVCNPLE
jgi:hypothetical protein